MIPLICGAVAVGYAYHLLSPVPNPEQRPDILLTIPPQATAGEVGDILERHQLVRSGPAFKWWARWKGKDGDLRAGEYRLSRELSAPQVLQELLSGQMELQKLTIPEGFTTSQVADLLEEKGIVSRRVFYQALVYNDFDYYFLENIPKDDRRMEGYLFPDTYQFVRGVGEAALIEMMLDRFTKEIEGLSFPVVVEGQEMNLHQVVTLASMIEREALFDSDMGLISGVIYNRMNIGMPLQIDATVQYALGEFKPRLLYRDLEVDSPYNTYKIPGLPPGPISMPGSKSLQAALNPITADGYYYYLARPDGHHVFSKTLEEHNIYKARYIE